MLAAYFTFSLNTATFSWLLNFSKSFSKSLKPKKVSKVGKENEGVFVSGHQMQNHLRGCLFFVLLSKQVRKSDILKFQLTWCHTVTVFAVVQKVHSQDNSWIMQSVWHRMFGGQTMKRKEQNQVTELHMYGGENKKSMSAEQTERYQAPSASAHVIQ